MNRAARAVLAVASSAFVVVACSSTGTAPTSIGDASPPALDATAPSDGSAITEASVSADDSSSLDAPSDVSDVDAAWSCSGSYGTIPAADGNYYITEFGCYVDDAGTHTDPDDNCIPGCLAKAQAAGLCEASDTGPDCEERVTWYTADAGRFGCLQRLRVTNPANGKTLIAVALDFGPACSGEATVQHAVLDSSGAVDDYLFGGPKGSSEKALVHVDEVADTTPLGPVP